MEIAATRLSGFSNPPSINGQAQTAAGSKTNDITAAPESTENRLADADLNEKAASIGKLHTAFAAAISLNGRLEGLLSPIF